MKCCSLSDAEFLVKNDINLTASCFEVDFSKDKCFQIHASPSGNFSSVKKKVKFLKLWTHLTVAILE